MSFLVTNTTALSSSEKDSSRCWIARRDSRRGWAGRVSWAQALVSRRACPGSTSRPTYSGRAVGVKQACTQKHACKHTSIHSRAHKHTHTHTRTRTHARTRAHTQLGELPGRGCVHDRADAQPLRYLHRADVAGVVARIFQEISKISRDCIRARTLILFRCLRAGLLYEIWVPAALGAMPGMI